MKCWVYKSSKKRGVYVYLAKQTGFDLLPEQLMSAFSDDDFVMSLELDEQRKLARNNVKEVMRYLDKQGYYLQLPESEVRLMRR